MDWRSPVETEADGRKARDVQVQGAGRHGILPTGGCLVAIAFDGWTRVTISAIKHGIIQ